MTSASGVINFFIGGSGAFNLADLSSHYKRYCAVMLNLCVAHYYDADAALD